MHLRDFLTHWTRQLSRSGIDSPRLECEILTASALGVSRLALVISSGRDLTVAEEKHCASCLERRCSGEPAAYITGKREFFGRDFAVSGETLIPRPETELLVETVLDENGEDKIFADIGTGSGCIGITLCLERPKWQGLLIELKPEAAMMAERNKGDLGAVRANVVVGDLFDLPLGEHCLDILVSNPPYIGTEEKDTVMPEVEAFEPHSALYSGKDGLDHIRALTACARRHLKKGGLFAMEHGMGQGQAIRKLLTEAGFSQIVTKKDLAGLDRVTAARI